MNEVQSDLLELEKGFWEAAGSDGNYYEINFSDNGIMILPFPGGILDKNQTIESVKQADAWDTYGINNVRVIKISPTYMVLLYEALGRRRGKNDYLAYVSSTYRNRDGTWELILHQQTALMQG